MRKRSLPHRIKILPFLIVVFCLFLSSCQAQVPESSSAEVPNSEKSTPRPEDILQNYYGYNSGWYVLDAAYGESQISTVVLCGTVK